MTVNNRNNKPTEMSEKSMFDRIAILVDALQDDKLPAEIRAQALAWFQSDLDLELKYAALEKIFLSLSPNLNPDRREYELLESIRKELGFRGEFRIPTQRRSLRISRILLRVAAVVLPLLMVAGGVYMWSGRETGSQQTITEVVVSATTTQNTITLPDGSTVTLEVGAELKYDDDFALNRHVSLSGDALFAVVKAYDEDGNFRPFTVATDNLTVNVHGTVFRVVDPRSSLHSDVSLYEGSVSVVAGATTTALEQGERLNYDNTRQQSTIALIPAQEMVDHGFTPQLRFEMSNLGNIITTLEANYKVKFVLPVDVDLKRGSYSGDFRQESLESTLAILTKSNVTYSFTLRNDKIIVTRK